MGKEFEYLSDRGDHGGHLSQVIAFTGSRFACRY